MAAKKNLDACAKKGKGKGQGMAKRPRKSTGGKVSQKKGKG